MAPPANPTPQTLTLLLKSHTTTVLLHVGKDDTFADVKAELLNALRSRGKPVPTTSDAATIHLARPVDPSDLSRGWESLERTEEEEDFERAMEQIDANGGGAARLKGKGRASLLKGRAGVIDGPAKAKMGDGSVMAFKFGRESEWEVSIPTFDDGELLEEEEEEEGEARPLQVVG